VSEKIKEIKKKIILTDEKSMKDIIKNIPSNYNDYEQLIYKLSFRVKSFKKCIELLLKELNRN